MVALVIFKNGNKKCNNFTKLKETKHANVFYSFDQGTKQESALNSENELVVQSSNLLTFKDVKDCEQLKGEFSIGKYDFAKNEFFGIRDRIGVKSFYYHNSASLFIYSTSLTFIKSFLKTVSVSEEWISYTLSGIPYSKSITFYNEIKQLSPAHYLRLNDKGLEVKKYWTLKSNGKTTLNDFSEKFVKAVKIRKGINNATELSGGLDSSGISGVLSQNVDQKLTAFRHVLDGSIQEKYFPFYDERKYSDLMLKHSSNIEMNDITSLNMGIVSELKAAMLKVGSPFFSTLPLFFDSLYKQAGDKGVDVLFSGFGGDEGVSSNSNHYLWELAYAGEWKILKKTLESGWFSKELIKIWLKRTLPSLKQRGWQKKKLENVLIRQELSDKFNIPSVFWDHHKQFDTNTLNESLVRKLENPALLSRLEANGQALCSYGVEYTYPLLDTDLLESYLSLPSNVKFNKNIDRYPFKEAIKPYVPKEIYLRSDKTGATIPTVQYRFMNDYDSIFEILHAYKNGKASEYLNIEEMIKRMPIIKARNKGNFKKERPDLRLFLVGLQLILFFDEGVPNEN